MNNKEPGYVYILTNPSFREDWVKICKSPRPCKMENSTCTTSVINYKIDK